MTITTPKPLTGASVDVLWQMFRNGPTWDGDLASKVGRSDRVDLGDRGRVKNWNWLTTPGVLLALELGYGPRKAKAQLSAGLPGGHQSLRGRQDSGGAGGVAVAAQGLGFLAIRPRYGLACPARRRHRQAAPLRRPSPAPCAP